MKWITLLLLSPGLCFATLIEWTGTGPQTYYYSEDQASPAATITILADQSRVHSVNIDNTKTSLTLIDPVIDWLYSSNLGHWSGVLLAQGVQPDYFVGDPTNSTPLNALVTWIIYGPMSNNPMAFLDQVRDVRISSPGSREFGFTPTEWSRSDTAKVPEPSPFILMLCGLMALAVCRRKNKS